MREWAGWQTTAQKLGFVCFFWGGGLLSLAGALAGRFGHAGLSQVPLYIRPRQGLVDAQLRAQPGVSARGLISRIVSAGDPVPDPQAIRVDTGGRAVLSASHPFTGISLALVLAGTRRWS